MTMTCIPSIHIFVTTLVVLILIHIPVANSAALYVSTGQDHTCALLHGHNVKCWGIGEFGRLGYEDTSDRGDNGDEMGSDLPKVDLGTGRTAVQISAGGYHTCAILDDGNVKCWGNGANGRLGYENTFNRGDSSGDMGDNLPTVDLGSGRTAVQIDAGFAHTCAVLDNGALKCWGYGGDGQLGYGNTLSRGLSNGEMGDQLPPIDLGTGRSAVEVVLGNFHTCAVLDDFSVKCWGLGDRGRLGLGDERSRGAKQGEMGDDLPAVKLGTGRTALHVATGARYTCAILDDGAVKCWGDESGYAYGDTRTRGSVPGEMGDNLPIADLGTGRTAVQIRAGDFHNCVLLDDATLKCWGISFLTGRLGYGNIDDIGDDPDELGDFLLPVDVGSGRTVLQVDCGRAHTCARLDDQTVKCWGWGNRGRLGYENQVDRGQAPGQMGDDLPTVSLGETISPTSSPTFYPTNTPSVSPTLQPSAYPTSSPTVAVADICGTDILAMETTILERSSFGCFTLPTQIGLMVELTKVEVANSYLLGTIPTELGNLRKLRELFLSGNDLAGTLPTEIGRLSNLEALHAFDNSFTGTFPTEIGLLTQLTALTLSDNELQQDLPSQFGELSNLEHLHVGQEAPLAFIPPSIGRLSNLVSLTLGEVCDCQIATILQGLTSLGATERLVAATCNGQPSTSLSSNNAIPCSPVRVATVRNISEYTAAVSLTYSNRTEIDKFASSFNVFTFSGTLFRTALDQFIQLNTSSVSPLDAKEIFSRCKAVFVSGFVDIQVWAFQFTLRNILTSEVNEHCVFAGDAALTRRAVGGLADNFILSLSIDPGEKYSLTVRPVVMSFESDKLVSYRFGPVSNSQRIVAGDSIPDGPVRSLTVQTREDDRVSLQWTEPEKSNGRITRYAVIRDNGISNVTLDFVILGESSQVSFTVPDLNAAARYTVYIYPETTKGRGPPVSIALETCPENLRTLKDETSRCVAKRGFFLGKNGRTAVSCSVLGRMIDTKDCLEDDLKVQDLSITSGFWRPSVDSFDIRRCPLGSLACTGGTNMSLCQPSYEGPMCSVCSDGFYFDGGQCETCGVLSSRPVLGLLGLAMVLFFMVLTVGIAVCLERSRAKKVATTEDRSDNEDTKEPENEQNATQHAKVEGCPSCSKLPLSDELVLKLKVLLSTYQIIGTFLWTLGTAFPRVYTDIVSFLSILSIDILDFVPVLQCLYGADFYTELLIVTLSPLAVLCFILVIAVVALRNGVGFKTVKAHVIWWYIIVTFVVYAPAVSKIFRAFRPCDEFPDIGQGFMPEDYTIVCDSPEHWKVLTAAIVMLVIYVFGIPGLYGVLLHNNRLEIRRQYELLSQGVKPSEKESEAKNIEPAAEGQEDVEGIQQESEPTPEEREKMEKRKKKKKDADDLRDLNEELSSIAFLYKSYSYYWWELIEVARKVVLAGVIAVINPGSFEQSALLMLFALASVALYNHLLPLRDNNALGLTASYAIFFAAFASLLMKLRTDFVDTSILEGLLIFAVLAPIFVAVFYRRGLLKSIDKSCCPDSVSLEDTVDEAFMNLKEKFGRLAVNHPVDEEAWKPTSARTNKNIDHYI